MMTSLQTVRAYLTVLPVALFGSIASAQICPEPYTQACCDAVCAIDDFCCSTEWDSTCDDIAKSEAECVTGGPPNTTCETAIEVTDGEVVAGTNIDAPEDGGYITQACGSDDSYGKDVWYFIDVAKSGVLTISTCNDADFDTRLFLYSSCSPDDMLACNDDYAGCAGYSSQLLWVIEEPGTYYIMIDGYGSAEGNFNLSVDLETAEAPANDDFADAIEIFEGPTEFSTILATTDGNTLPGDQCSALSNFENDIWFTFTATETILMAFTTSDATTNYDSQIEILDDTGLSLACNDDGAGAGPVLSSLLLLNVEAAATYTVRIGSAGAGYGSGTLHIARAPDNDECADAIALTMDVAEPLNTYAASSSSEPGLPEGSPCNTFGVAEFFGDVWYTFETPATAFYTITMCELTYVDTRIGVYDACGGNLLFCNDDACALQSEIYMGELNSGTQLVIRVGGFYAGTNRAVGIGSIIINGEGIDPCLNDQTVFDFASDFSATEGPATIAAAAGDTSWFEFTTDSIGGEDTGVVHVLGQHDNTQALSVNYSFCPNPQDAVYVNNFTLMWDVKVTANWIPLFNANDGETGSYNDAELFVTPLGQLYIAGAGYLGAEGLVQPDTWYRIALVEDLSTGDATVYINGELAVVGEGAVTYDGPHSLWAHRTMIFSDNNSETGEAWLSSYLIDDRAMSSAEILALGGPTAGGLTVPGGGGGGSCDGDINGDGFVDGADLTMLLGAWGSAGTGGEDIDGSGQVDGADLTILLGGWGSC